MSTVKEMRAVVFDLDGTLLNTLEDIADSMNAVLSRRGFPDHPVGAYKMFVGDGARMLATRALPRDRSTEDLVDACELEFKTVYGRNWKAKTRPYPGIEDLLLQLRRDRVPLGILSNKPHEYTVQCVQELLPGNVFAVIQGQNDGVPPKPDPAGARMVCSRLGAAPEQVLYVGDTGVDMQTGRRSGMVPIGVLWGFREARELQEHGAHSLVERPDEVLALLQGQRAGSPD